MDSGNLAMRFDDDQERALDDVGEEILVALTTVAHAVQQALSERRPKFSPKTE
jgi:hypothetical protein